MPPTHPPTLVWRRQLETCFGADPFTSGEALRLGITYSRLNRLLASGLLARGLHGVYRLHEMPSLLMARAQEATTRIPGAVIARRTSAWFLGEDARPPAEKAELPIDCVVPRGRMPNRSNGIHCYQSDLTPEDITRIGTVPCTTPARTAADLLRWAPPHMALACVDQMARSGIVTSTELNQVLARWPGERNVRRARRLVSFLDPLSESYGESWLRLRILDAGFPAPEAQIPILNDHGRVVYRLDLGWRRSRLAIEYDGEEFHASPRQVAADRRRREDLRVRFGWEVIGVGRGEVLGSSLALERGVGELLSLEPTIRRRSW
ncbi:type IV toxin-antitoxin system AbiEi family antitoxin domain-containing protein [Kineosporia sp. NBRC 101731]|uniref:type IV toxin-antitoxin system AbiEi family antitoxin domain-containing protein n=1 Tax=Kineosporia sp. NBRC 101731 TaxID=3032199 RepID=UPI0024A5B5DC|nr:type IV toxin-antitoxin system AbiEi family antitoxin domain-containing protein [Kineosporia sp. NBRC 101731]GLY28027.1 hypothetical protein Kisp02_13920 [Kineosporia sp. NBRC 101731]